MHKLNPERKPQKLEPISRQLPTGLWTGRPPTPKEIAAYLRPRGGNSLNLDSEALPRLKRCHQPEFMRWLDGRFCLYDEWNFIAFILVTNPKYDLSQAYFGAQAVTISPVASPNKPLSFHSRWNFGVAKRFMVWNRRFLGGGYGFGLRLIYDPTFVAKMWAKHTDSMDIGQEVREFANTN